MRPDYERRKQAYARRRFLQFAARQGNISLACRLWGWTRKTYYKWKHRYDGTLESLLDRPRRPHRHPRQLSAAAHQLILRVARKHKRAGLYRLHWLLCTHHGFTGSVGAVYKALRRLGFYGPRKLRRRRKYKRYEQPWPGANVQIDVKYLPQIRQRQEYQFTAIDEYSRLRYVDLSAEITPRQATRFLREALDFFERHQVRVQQVQTDHGTEFTYAMYPHCTADHPFERLLRQEGIRHQLTPIGKPHLQGKVERAHRIDDHEFHSCRCFRTSPARARAFKAYVHYYNHQRPHGSLNWRTPAQCLDDYLRNQSVTYV